MELDAQDLKRGLKFIVGTWQVDYVVNAWSNDLKHIPASEFKSDDGNDLSAITYTFFEDHTMVMKNSADGKEEQGSWEQTDWGEFHYTLNGFLNLPDSNFLKGAETLSMRDGEELVFSLGFLAVAMKKIGEGTVTEAPGIGDTEMTAEDEECMDVVGVYKIEKTMAMVDDDFGLHSREEVTAALEKKKAAGELDEGEYEGALRGFDVFVEIKRNHKIVQWMPVPKGVPAEQIKEALEAGDILDYREDGYFAVQEQPWKCLGGKYYYDTGEHREVFGEEQSSWDELKFNEEGLMEFASGMMLLKRTEA